MSNAEYSRVSIEFCEQETPGNYNVVQKSSGTFGQIKVGEDIAYALTDVPRPLLALAEAIKVTFDRSESKSHPLLRAATAYIARWQNYDVCVAHGADPLENYPDHYRGSRED